MQGLLARLDHPALRDITIDWPAGADAYPRQLPDLYLGEPLLVTAKLPQPSTRVQVHGQLADRRWTAPADLSVPGPPPGWIACGPNRASPTWRISWPAVATQAALAEQITDTALAAHLVSRYTSLVAVDRTPARSAETRARTQPAAQRDAGRHPFRANGDAGRAGTVAGTGRPAGGDTGLVDATEDAMMTRQGVALADVLPRCLLAAGLGLSGVWIHAKAALAQVLLARAWAQSDHGRRIQRPWPWADMAPIARLSVPRLHQDLIVLDGDNGQALAFGPGWTPGSAGPASRGAERHQRPSRYPVPLSARSFGRAIWFIWTGPAAAATTGCGPAASSTAAHARLPTADQR